MCSTRDTPGGGNDASLGVRLRKLLDGQRLGVLATQDAAGPYTSLLAFAVDADGGVLFCTARDSRKWRNLQADPRVALLIDDRTHRAEDFDEACAVSLLGDAGEVRDGMRKALLVCFTARHAALAAFARSEETVLFRLIPSRCLVVDRFQRVREWRGSLV